MNPRTGTWIWMAALGGAGIGYAADSIGLMAGAMGWGSIVFLLHRIEVKLNRLLDDRGIQVLDTDD